jgi:hypothetical protein
MATKKQKARLWVVKLDINKDAAFGTIVCAVNNAMSFSSATVDTSSKCGDEEFPDKQKASLTGEFFVGLTLTAGQESLAAIFDAWQDQITAIPFKFGPDSPVTGDVVYTGTLFISEIAITTNDGDMAKFNMTAPVDITGLTQTVTA